MYMLDTLLLFLDKNVPKSSSFNKAFLALSTYPHFKLPNRPILSALGAHYFRHLALRRPRHSYQHGDATLHSCYHDAMNKTCRTHNSSDPSNIPSSNYQTSQWTLWTFSFVIMSTTTTTTMMMMMMMTLDTNTQSKWIFYLRRQCLPAVEQDPRTIQGCSSDSHLQLVFQLSPLPIADSSRIGIRQANH